MTAQDEHDEVGRLSVGDLVENLGQLGGRTLAELTGRPLPAGDTPMTLKCVTAWNVPLARLTWEQVRLLLGQGLGVPWTSMAALDLLRRAPGAMVTFYPGDLSSVVLRSFPEIFAVDPDGARGFLAGDFGWIAVQLEIDASYGTRSASDAQRNLVAARRLAASL